MGEYKTHFIGRNGIHNPLIVNRLIPQVTERVECMTGCSKADSMGSAAPRARVENLIPAEVGQEPGPDQHSGVCLLIKS
jgi:hypothetical protein